MKTFTLTKKKGKQRDEICGVSERRLPIIRRKWELEGWTVTDKEGIKLTPKQVWANIKQELTDNINKPNDLPI